MKWSVGIEAEGDRVLSREEIVELADAVAASSGIATGIGTNRYGAQLLVEAGTRDEAIGKATGEFTRAVAKAGLPAYPVVRVEAIGEDEDAESSGGEYGDPGGEHGSSSGEFRGSEGEFEGPSGEFGGSGGEPGGSGTGKDAGG